MARLDTEMHRGDTEIHREKKKSLCASLCRALCISV